MTFYHTSSNLCSSLCDLSHQWQSSVCHMILPQPEGQERGLEGSHREKKILYMLCKALSQENGSVKALRSLEWREKVYVPIYQLRQANCSPWWFQFLNSSSFQSPCPENLMSPLMLRNDNWLIINRINCFCHLSWNNCQIWFKCHAKLDSQ